MVVLAWSIALIGTVLWWLWCLDLPDRNPFAVVRVQRLVILGLFLLLVLAWYKAALYRTELRFTIQSCQ